MVSCGIFWGSHYKYDLNLYTNLLLVDIAHIEDKKTEIKRILINDPKIAAVWDSVSGQGFKVLLHVDYSIDVLLENQSCK